MNNQLSASFKRYVDFTDETLAKATPYFKKIQVPRKEFLLKKDAVCKYRYFITKGLFRIYYIDRDAKEVIIHFGIENWWMTDFDSLVNQSPSNLFIQAIEESTVMAIHQNQFDSLCIEVPEMEKFFRIIAERAYIASQRRIQFMFTMSGEEIYNTFANAFPEYASRIPQYMLASYLGFTPEFISKIKSKKQPQS